MPLPLSPTYTYPRRMSVRIMAQVWDDLTITSQADLIVLLALADFSNDNGESWPAMDSIAKKCRASERGVRKIIRRLESEGRIKVKIGGSGPRATNVYQILRGNPVPPQGGTPFPSRGNLSALKGEPECIKGGTACAPDPSGSVIDPSVHTELPLERLVSAKSKPEPKPPNLEHKAFIEAWCSAFKGFHGFDYLFEGGRDGKAVKEMLSNGVPWDGLLEIAKKCWDRHKFNPSVFVFSKGTTLHEFKSYLNQIRTELQHVNGNHSQGYRRNPAENPRNIGTYTPKTDYAAVLARRERAALVGQVAENPAPREPGAAGT